MPLKKLTNKIVDERVSKYGVRRRENYINTMTPIKWECTICGYVWEALFCNVSRSDGPSRHCPKCNDALRLTNEIVDNRVKEQGREHLIKRVGDVVHSLKKILWRCGVGGCGHEWLATPKLMLIAKHGCPKCVVREKLTDETIDRRLVNRKIKRISNVIDFRTRLRWLCLVCGYEWVQTSIKVICGGHGCPDCAGQAPLTNKLIDNKLKKQFKDHLLERVGDAVGTHVPILWRCKIEGCGNEWLARPNSIVNKGGGCPRHSRSKGHKAVEAMLIKNNIKYIPEKRFGGCKYRSGLSFDFYLPDFRCCIEYNGKQHYTIALSMFTKLFTKEEAEKNLKEYKIRDDIKSQYCVSEGFKLVIIPYWDLSRIEEIIKDRILLSNLLEYFV